MLAETMRALKFNPAEISKRAYLGGEIGEDDAVGLWSDTEQQICICCFPTPDTIPAIIEYKKWTNINSIFVIINQQFFLDPLSKNDSKNFLSSAEIIYRLESLNMRGPGALPVRGILYRQYPHMFKVCMSTSTLVFTNRIHFCNFTSFIPKQLIFSACVLCRQKSLIPYFLYILFRLPGVLTKEAMCCSRHMRLSH